VKSEQGMKQGAWINAIIGRLCAYSAPMVILFDYDGLTSNSAIFEHLVGKGYDVYDYTDNLSLFFYFESYKQKESNGVDSKLMIRISADLADNAQLPYSVMVNAERIELRLEDFFIGLNAKAIKELPSQYCSNLFELLSSQPQNLAAYNESIDFITRRVFGIDQAGISNEVQFWAILFKLHYTDTELPGFLVDKLHDAGDRFVTDYKIDLRYALESSEHFFAFLQNEWSRFVDDRINHGANITVLPFDHPDLKVYTDNFFAEGMLQRVRIDATRDGDLGWISCGIELKTSDPVDQIESMMSLLQSHLPGLESSFRDWQKFSRDYAELLLKLYSVNDPQKADSILKLRAEINDRFQNWIQQHYDSLSSLPSSKPVMVHQVAKSMAYRRAALETPKTALIVMDGMSFDQWLCIKAELDLGGYNLHEDALFAWLPTLTSISRQSIFNASVPYYLAQQIGSTVKEPKHWQRYWEDNGVPSQSISYLRMDGTGDIGAELEKQVNLRSALVIGLVLNVIDDIMHGMNLGSAGMHSQIKHWVKQGYFASLLQILIDHGYTVWIISDHGNLECEGIGNIPDGALSETKASRVRIYQSEALRDRAVDKTESSLAWTPKGLPNDLYCLFAPYRGCYHPVGKKIVAHGGISLEEVMVPFVKINWTSI
jgi:hypothetical protein